MRTLEMEIGYAENLVFSPDGRALLASYETAHVAWPDWASGGALPPLLTDARPDRSAWAPDNSGVFMSVSVGTGSAVRSRTRFLALASGRVEECGVPGATAGWFHFTAAGGFAIVSQFTGPLSRYDCTPGQKKLERQWVADRGRAYSHYAFGAVGAAGETFASIEVTARGRAERCALVVRSARDGGQLSRIDLDDDAVREMTNFACPCTFHPGGRRAAARGSNGVVSWPLLAPAGEPLIGRVPGTEGAYGVAYHPNGRWLAVATDGNAVRFLDAEGGAPVSSFEVAAELGFVTTVALSPDGRFVAASGSEGRVAVWDASEARPV